MAASGTTLGNWIAFVTAMAGVAGLAAYLVWRSLEPGKLILRCVITALVAGGLYLIAHHAGRNLAILASLPSSIVMILTWRRPMTEMVGEWFGGLYTGGGRELEPAPLYSMAQARRKQGRYAEAIAEVQRQLEQFPNDFTGLMLLADIYAQDLKDLSRAREFIETIQGEPAIAPNHVAYALNRRADWELSFAEDREAARECLEEIVRRFPGTEAAQLALQRIAHLTPQGMLSESKEPHRMALQRGDDRLGLRQDTASLRPADERPEDSAAKLVEQLERFPNDSEAREKLALLYARHYRRMDLAVDQLEQLIGAPGQTPKQVVHWLNLLADLQIELDADPEAARETLERIVVAYPKSAAAQNAASRKAHLNLEMRPQQAVRVVKLRKGEDNLGLKGPSNRPGNPEDSS